MLALDSNPKNSRENDREVGHKKCTNYKKKSIINNVTIRFVASVTEKVYSARCRPLNNS